MDKIRLMLKINDPVALFELGCRHLDGEGGKPIRPGKGYRLIAKAAHKGDIDALNKMGDCYYFGLGVLKDVQDAIYWYQKAADEGHQLAQANLGEAYFYGEGVEQNAEMAFEWHFKAAEKGLPMSQHHLGISYYKGLGVEQNTLEAIKWLRLAADQGYHHAQYNLGFAFHEGVESAVNMEEAIKWYKRAAKNGNVDAWNSLGELLIAKATVPSDIKKGYQLILQAARKGNMDSILNLAKFYENGTHVKRDYVIAYAHYYAWFNSQVKQELAEDYMFLPGTIEVADEDGTCESFGKGLRSSLTTEQIGKSISEGRRLMREYGVGNTQF